MAAQFNRHENETSIATTSRWLRWAWTWTFTVLVASAVLIVLLHDAPVWTIASIAFGFVSTVVCFGSVLRLQLTYNDYRRFIKRRSSEGRQ